MHWEPAVQQSAAVVQGRGVHAAAASAMELTLASRRIVIPAEAGSYRIVIPAEAGTKVGGEAEGRGEGIEGAERGALRARFHGLHREIVLRPVAREAQGLHAVGEGLVARGRGGRLALRP